MTEAFYTAAGASAPAISIFIRSVLCAIFFMWSAWNVYGQMRLVQHGECNIHELSMGFFRIAILCALMVILIFVS
jgi:integrating conjugative element protein (TIGR03758 family)